jgi:hypothetical protein
MPRVQGRRIGQMLNVIMRLIRPMATVASRLAIRADIARL